jgi:SAM-dependent methyltransferase
VEYNVVMDANNRFILEFAQNFAASHASARILDFGCGEGLLVRAAREFGLDMCGADVFYDTTSDRDKDALRDILGVHVHQIVDGRIPFPDQTYDLVVNNQVMEHVDDLDGALAEIDRVLKPGGQVLSLFPTLEVWREPHIGIPLCQRFPKNSRARYYYTRILRSAGIGDTNKAPSDSAAWAKEWLDWIDTYTRYRSRKDVLERFDRHFTNTSIERENIRFRLRERSWGSLAMRAMTLPGAMPIAESLFRRLAFVVVQSSKPVASEG